MRNRKFEGKKFLRQHPLIYNEHGVQSFFIADFYCHEALLVIELDGEVHNYRKDYDTERELYFERMERHYIEI